MFNLLYIRIVILLIACGISAYTDYKKGYIYNYVTYPLIGIGILLNIFEYLIINRTVFGITFLIKTLLIALAIYGVGYLIYYYGKIGGGDIKLFIGIYLILPYYNNQLFFLWVLIISCLLAVFFVSLRYLVKLRKKIKFTKKLLVKKKYKIIKSVFLFLIFLFFIYKAVNISGFPKFSYLMLLPVLLGLKAMIFEEEIKKYIYLRHKPISKLEDGDVIARERISQTILNKLKLKNRDVLEERDLKNIRKLKLKTFPIYDYLPRFGPYIFLGIIFVLLFSKYFIF